MGLDYSQGCVNFRDVGVWVNEIAGRTLLPPERILRGGKLDFVKASDEIGHPGTIVNLRKGSDVRSDLFEADYFHFPISNDYEKYRTQTPEVRRWLGQVMQALASEITAYPVLFHCTSGKDRTGVVVAALLLILGVDAEIIVEEYLLSDGKVRREWIEEALAGMECVAVYFRRVDVGQVMRSVLGS